MNRSWEKPKKQPKDEPKDGGMRAGQRRVRGSDELFKWAGLGKEERTLIELCHLRPTSSAVVIQQYSEGTGIYHTN